MTSVMPTTNLGFRYFKMSVTNLSIILITLSIIKLWTRQIAQETTRYELEDNSVFGKLAQVFIPTEVYQSQQDRLKEDGDIYMKIMLAKRKKRKTGLGVRHRKPHKSAQIKKIVYKQNPTQMKKTIVYKSKPTPRKKHVIYHKAKVVSRKNINIASLSEIYSLKEVNCGAIFRNVTAEVQRGVEVNTMLKEEGSLSISASDYISGARDCATFKKTRGYITSSLTEEEENFPIAFSIVAFTDPELIERLLRIIYRPQNVYCIHIDRKSQGKVYNATMAVASCFDNVFMAPRRVSVTWGGFSVLEPDLICMEALLGYKRWKYFINLTGQEFPLKTNFELVKILKAYNGANDVEGTIKRSNPGRWEKTKVPPGITVVKGSMKVAINRDFVDYVINNVTGQAVVDWLRTFCDTCVPDEQLFSTLNHNPQLGIRGAYLGEPETDNSTRKPFLARFVNWDWEDIHVPCTGRQFRGICILSTGDLHVLKHRRELFANKFYLSSRYGDRVALGCMEEWLYNRTRDQAAGRVTFNVEYYEQLGFVRDQVLKPSKFTD